MIENRAKGPRKISVLFVCLGNICRSPMAEGIFRQQVQAAGLGPYIFIDSAGTADYHIGEGPDVRARYACASRGVDIDQVKGRQASPEDFYFFDYILAMDEHNLQHLKSIRPRDGYAHLSLFTAFGKGPYKGKSVPDPYSGGIEGFHQLLDILEDGAQGLLEKIRRDHAL